MKCEKAAEGTPEPDTSNGGAAKKAPPVCKRQQIVCWYHFRSLSRAADALIRVESVWMKPAPTHPRTQATPWGSVPSISVRSLASYVHWHASIGTHEQEGRWLFAPVEISGLKPPSTSIDTIASL